MPPFPSNYPAGRVFHYGYDVLLRALFSSYRICFWLRPLERNNGKWEVMENRSVLFLLPPTLVNATSIAVPCFSSRALNGQQQSGLVAAAAAATAARNDKF